MARGRGRCGDPQAWLCAVGVTVSVLSAGAGRWRRTVSSDTRRAGGRTGLLLRGVSCWQLWGAWAAATVPQSPCCAVLSLFLAVTRRLFILPGSALNTSVVLVDTTLLLP